MTPRQRAIALRALEAVILLDFGLFAWALVGEGLVVRVGGEKILSATSIDGPLWVFWSVFVGRVGLGLLWARPADVEAYRNGRRRWLLRLGTPVLILFLCLTLGEAAARIFRSEDRAAGERILEGARSDGGPLRPAAATVIEGVGVHTNSLGFRDREFPVERPPDQLRLLAVGDSFTFGNKVADDDTWPQQLEALLADETGRDVEVINGGLWGLDTVQEVENVRKWVPMFDPEIVVLAFVLNDVVTITPTAPADRNLHEKSLLYRWLRERYWHTAYVVGHVKNFDFDDGNPGWAAARKALLEFRDLSGQLGFRPLVVIYPYMIPWGANDSANRTLLVEYLASIDLACLDLFPVFESRQGDPALQCAPGDEHPSAEGYAMAVRAIADRLRAGGGLEGPGRD